MANSYKPIRAKQAAQILGVSANTVRNWCHDGRLPYELSAAGQRIFDYDTLIRIRNEGAGITPPALREITIFYARSSSGDDVSIETQLSALTAVHGQPDHTITDKGSGLNDHRTGLDRLYHLVREHNPEVEHLTVHVTNKDRLTRFGSHYLAEYFDSHGVALSVLDSDETKEPQEVLMQDFMSLIASFSGKFYRLRGWKQRKALLDRAQQEVDANVQE